jgi:DNA-binding MarR family transcriptional regulator
MTSQELRDQVAADLRRLSTEIDRLDQAAADRYGLNRTDMRALDIVGMTGPLAPTALARMLGFTTGGVTSVLDRLELAGYIRRQPHPGDRRRQVVQVTEATAARDREVFGELMARTGELLTSYTSDQLLAIHDFLDRIGQLTAAHADSLSEGDGGTAPGPAQQARQQ